MTLLKTLRAHTGGLIRLKEELYWRGGAGWDGTPGRVCLVLDAARGHVHHAAATARGALASDTTTAAATIVLLLIEGAPHWVWVARADVEIL